VICIVVILLQHFIRDILHHAPFVPTDKKRVDQLVEMAQIKKHEVVCDLGCGDGRLLFGASQRAAKCIGYEISWVPYFLAKIKTRKCSNIEIKLVNFMKEDLSQIDIFFVYLLPKRSYDRLRKKLIKEMKPNARIVAEAFSFKECQAGQIKYFVDKGPVYIYSKEDLNI